MKQYIFKFQTDADLSEEELAEIFQGLRGLVNYHLSNLPTPGVQVMPIELEVQ